MANILDTWTDPWTIKEVPVLPEGTSVLNLSDTKITVLDGATLPRSITHITITLSPIHTVRNLHLLPNLVYLNLTRSMWLDTLETELPPSLLELTLNHCMYLKSLPRLSRTRMIDLNLYGCANLTRIPELPSTLRSITFDRCDAVTEMPFLPDSLTHLSTNVRFSVRGQTGYLQGADVARILADQRTRLRKERFETLHEELMAAAWHPKRVEKWLLQGEHVLDNIMGC